MSINEHERDRLLAAARMASLQAYCPYSHTSIGAAVLTEDGKIFSGCNVENASFGLTMCAERNAIGSAITAGARRFRAVAVYSEGACVTPPCGMCRQVILEFAPVAEVFCMPHDGEVISWSLSDLLPHPFEPGHLQSRGETHRGSEVQD